MEIENAVRNAKPGDKLSLVDFEAVALGLELREDGVTMELTRNEKGTWDTTYVNHNVWELSDPRGPDDIPADEILDPEYQEMFAYMRFTAAQSEEQDVD